MPARKSGGSETTTQPDSRRSSLRRLSSIASFQTLFSRRRSNNATNNTAASSSSNLSLASTAGNAPAPSSFINKSTSSLQHDTVPELLPPPATHLSSRQSSYICLPDDPIGGMPRSRTFSNLPLPTRAKKTNPIAPSGSHARLPSAIFPSSRLPSPQMSTRKHSHSRLLSAEAMPPPVRNRMKRSDTEPLLGVNVQQSSLLPRSTAFKENISLSPIKPLPALDKNSYRHKYPSPLPGPLYGERPWKEKDSNRRPSVGSTQFSSSPPLQLHHRAQKFAASREHKSSPIPRPQDRKPPLFAPVQRFSSQPVLTANTNVHNRRNSQHAEVKQTRLMSARHPPTPPLATSPLRSSQSRSTTATKPSSSSPTRSRQKSAQPTSLSRSIARKPAPAAFSPKRVRSVIEISHPEPPSYWAGRLSALLDRYRNEELATYINLATHPSKTQTDKMHTPEASTARIHRAFKYFHSLCVVQEAKESLTAFQCQYAEVMRMPELRKMAPIVLGGTPGGDSKELTDAVGAAEEGLVGMSEGRKISFMDRLLGRQKRRSLVLV